MRENSRQFEVQDPFGRTWQVEFRWLQNGISIRHADTVDVKYYLTSPDEQREAVVALPHAALTRLAQDSGRAVTDAWCLHLAAQHLTGMIGAWQDMEQAIATVPARELARLAQDYETWRQQQQREAQLHH
jgi:hypothetical protein